MLHLSIGFRLRSSLSGKCRPCSVMKSATTQLNKELLAMDLPTNDNNPDLLKARHTASHVLAMAVQKLYPDVKVTIGPWIENG
jgi:threonyl-tRNA synthetase